MSNPLIFNQNRSKQCCICGQYGGLLQSIGRNRQSLYFKKFNIASHHKHDQICSGCNDEHVDALNMNQMHIVDGNANKDRLHVNLLSLSSSLIKPCTTRISIYNVNEKGYQTMINLSPHELDQIVQTSISLMNTDNVDILATIKSLYDKPVAENADNYIVYGSNPSNYSTKTFEVLKNMYFEFYYKCRCGSSFKLQSFNHQRGEKTLRRYFHTTLSILCKYFQSNYYGFGHISLERMRQHQTIFINTINSFLRIPIVIFADGFSHSMQKYTNFLASYMNYSPKSNSECRNSHAFTLYVYVYIWFLLYLQT